MEIFLIIVAFFAIGSIFALLKGIDRFHASKKESTRYHFAKKPKVMTNAEERFFEKLTKVIGDRFIIIPQAHLSTFIEHKIVGQNWKAAFSTINGKSVDFLLVEKSTLSPVAAIELDDWSHEREDRILRDEKVDTILKEIGIPLVRFDSPEISEQAIVDTFYQVVQKKG